jgi:hypothetical protein
MGLAIKTLVRVECLSCGKTGTATTTPGALNGISAATAPDGFHVKLMPNRSVQIVCSGCNTTAYEAK